MLWVYEWAAWMGDADWVVEMVWRWDGKTVLKWVYG